MPRVPRARKGKDVEGDAVPSETPDADAPEQTQDATHPSPDASPESDGDKHDKLVVVGSSAGGIQALSILVGTLPHDFPAPVVLAQHLDPTRPSNLSSILQRRSAL